MSIFAMALPYTDCGKYDTYIVTTAHQVIADWFTRCRLIFRKEFVSLIVAALRPNDTAAGMDAGGSGGGISNENRELHEDMTDVCMDMMARYSFSIHHGQPKRSALVEFLLSQGSSQTWLVGNVLVTVTTSPSDKQNCECFKRRYYKKQPSRETEVENPIKTSTKEEESRRSENISIIPTPLAKLTQSLIEQSDFSPSEKLLFSRQASKVVGDDVDGDVDDDEDDDDEDECCDSDHIDSPQSGHRVFDVDVESNRTKADDEINTKLKRKFTEDSASAATANNSNRAPAEGNTAERANDPALRKPVLEPPLTLEQCQCHCSGWAEILIQRPTGKISWIMKMESRESMNVVDFSDLMLLAKNLECDNGTSVSGE